MLWKVLCYELLLAGVGYSQVQLVVSPTGLTFLTYPDGTTVNGQCGGYASNSCVLTVLSTEFSAPVSLMG